MKTAQQQTPGPTNVAVPIPTQNSLAPKSQLIVTPDDDDFGEEDHYNFPQAGQTGGTQGPGANRPGQSGYTQPAQGQQGQPQGYQQQGGQIYQDGSGQPLPTHGMKYAEGKDGLPERRRGPYDEQASDESIDIEDCRQIREKTAANRHRVNAGVDTFSLQFAEEKKSLRIKKECYTNTGAQFGQERVSMRFEDMWLQEREQRMKLRGEQDGYSLS